MTFSKSFVRLSASGATSDVKSLVLNVENIVAAYPLIELFRVADQVARGIIFDMIAICKPFVMTARIAKNLKIEYQIPMSCALSYLK